MRKAVVAGVAAAAVVVAAFVLAPTAWTQAVQVPEAQPAPRPAPRAMWLDGRGSSIGVRVRDLSGEDLEKTKLPQGSGAVVDDVEDDSPAEKAGLRRGDVIVEFDGERVRSARQLSRLVQETPDGRSVRATIVRDGSRQTLDVTPEAGARFGRRGDVTIDLPDLEREVERGLRALPRNFSFDFDWDAVPGPRLGARGRLGVRLQPLTEQLAAHFGASEGVLVSSVDEGSPAGKAGLKAGDVIMAVNGRAVSEPGDVSRELRDSDTASSVEITVMRERKPLTLKAELPDRRATPRRYTRPA
jgi:predicted metalloprotease with PDZ domain